MRYVKVSFRNFKTWNEEKKDRTKCLKAFLSVYGVFESCGRMNKLLWINVNQRNSVDFNVVLNGQSLSWNIKKLSMKDNFLIVQHTLFNARWWTIWRTLHSKLLRKNFLERIKIIDLFSFKIEIYVDKNTLQRSINFFHNCSREKFSVESCFSSSSSFEILIKLKAFFSIFYFTMNLQFSHCSWILLR